MCTHTNTNTNTKKGKKRGKKKKEEKKRSKCGSNTWPSDRLGNCTTVGGVFITLGYITTTAIPRSTTELLLHLRKYTLLTLEFLYILQQKNSKMINGKGIHA
jgi:hypothetical protein